MLYRSSYGNTVVKTDIQAAGSEFLSLQSLLSSTSYIYLSKDRPTFMLTGSGDPWPTFELRCLLHVCVSVAVGGGTVLRPLGWDF